MYDNTKGGNQFGPVEARRLLAALFLQRGYSAQTPGAPVFPVGDEPYLTDAVLSAYQRLIDVANGESDEGPEMAFTMSVQEGGRLLQLVIEGAMAHARGHRDGEPWFTCETGLRAVRLAVDVFAGLVDKAEYR